MSGTFQDDCVMLDGIRMYATYFITNASGTSLAHGPPVQIGELVYAIRRVRDVPRYDLEPIILEVVGLYADCSIDVCWHLLLPPFISPVLWTMTHFLLSVFWSSALPLPV